MELKASNSGSVLTFGEILLRFVPDADGKWLKNNKLPFYVVGAELNVATALALFGVPTKYFTAVPDNELSDQIIVHLKGRNIDTTPIYRGGSRLGVFYLTQGKDLKNSAVIYDRAGSAFAELTTGVIDWDSIFKGVSWLHFSAICPALSQQTAELCEEMLIAASHRNITISVDLNYRAKLWKYGKEPDEIMSKLAQYCDLIMGNLWASEKLLGIPVPKDIDQSAQKNDYLQAALNSSMQMMQQYPKCKAVANTFRFDKGNGINYYSALYTNNQLYHSAEYNSDSVLDKVGTGDCFMGGLIYGFYNQKSPSDILNFATAAAFRKFFIEGDATNSTVEEINNTVSYEN
jgi:2-dehydro-3-deoxygluconokinase